MSDYVGRCLLVMIAACANPPPPTAPDQPSGRVQALRIGELDAYVLADGHLEVPNDGQLLGFGRAPSETADVLAAAGLPRETIHLDIQCLLVEANGRVILFDAGMGEGSSATTGHLGGSLALARVPPGAITDVFISHAHSDHMGGLLAKGGALAFPAATIHMSAPEWTSLQANTDDMSKRFVAAIAANVAPFEPGAQVLPAVKAIAAPGHTPGHSSYEIAGALVHLGDVAHHSIVSVQHPTWSFGVDADRTAGETTRSQMLAKLAADRMRVFAGHFPFPGIGYVTEEAGGLVWQRERFGVATSK